MAWVGFLVGVIIIAFTVVSLVTTFVLPRWGSRFQLLPIVLSRGVRLIFLFLARPARTFARKDDILAAVGPVTLIARARASSSACSCSGTGSWNFPGRRRWATA